MSLFAAHNGPQSTENRQSITVAKEVVMMTGKWALITGASSGIGEETAKLLSQNGYNLILTGRRKERLEAVATKLKSEEVIVAPFDVSKRKDVESFLQKHSSYLQHVDVLVNNAGLAKGTDKAQEASLDDWDVMIDTNLKGLMQMTRGLLPYFVARNSGHIVNIGSVAGRWVYPGGAVYCASKFGVRAFTEGLRMDLIGKNIRVTNIEPGMVETEFSVVRFGDADKASKVYAGMKPLTAQDIAETIVWVLGRPKHVNIQEMVVFPTDQASIGQVHRQ